MQMLYLQECKWFYQQTDFRFSTQIIKSINTLSDFSRLLNNYKYQFNSGVR